MTTETVKVDQFIAAAPAQVWSAITTPEGLARWWVPGNIQPSAGHEFELEMPGWGNIPCKVLGVEPGHRFDYTFANWTLRWTVVPEGEGTRLILEHEGFDLSDPQHRFAFENMGPGWRDEVLPRLATDLERSGAAR